MGFSFYLPCQSDRLNVVKLFVDVFVQFISERFVAVDKAT